MGTRRVEMLMAFRPAGLQTPPGSVPPATPVHVDPEIPANVKLLTRPGGGGLNACHDLLAKTGWT